MSVNIISELPFLYQELEQQFEIVFRQVLESIDPKAKIQRYHEFDYLFSDIIHPLLKYGFFKNAKLVKQDSVGEYSDFNYINMYKFEGEKPYFVIVATYVGSCYGCLNRYKCNCPANNDNSDCICESKPPTTIKFQRGAYEHFKNRFLDCFKSIVAKSTIVENEIEALEMFSEISKKVLDDEQEIYASTFMT
jgi:hypothetical protein